MPNPIRTTLALLPLLALGACQSSGSGMKAFSSASSATAIPGLAFVAVQGPEASTAKKFEGILAEEAKRKGLSVGSGLQVKTFLDSYTTPDGKTGYSWVLDASGDGRSRYARAKGTALLGAGAATPWAAFDEAAMRQVARMGLDDLTRQLQTAGSPDSGAPATADE